LKNNKSFFFKPFLKKLINIFEQIKIGSYDKPVKILKP